MDKLKAQPDSPAKTEAMRILGKRMGYYSKQVIKGGTVEGTGDNLRTVINKANVKTPAGATMTIAEREALKIKMQAQEKASKAGYQAGRAEMKAELEAQFKAEKFSDHAPLTVDYDFQL
jgi:hypothetical protein